MLLADLKSMAAGLAIPGAGSMKKAQLVDAIKASQSGAGKPAAASRAGARRAGRPSRLPRSDRATGPGHAGPEQAAEQPTEQQPTEQQPDRAAATRPAGQKQGQPSEQPEQQDQQQQPEKQDRQQQAEKQDRPAAGPAAGQQPQDKQDRQQEQPAEAGPPAAGPPAEPAARTRPARTRTRDQNDDGDDDGEGGSRRNRRRRGRDRERTPVRPGGRNEPDTTILEDDVLVPAAGILDVLDNCAFVRTSGYLPGPEDVYLSLSMVRKYHLRRGDAVVGQVRQPREGERREKFNPMVRIDSINGTDAEGAKDRPDFADAVPVHPHQRLRLATDEANLIGRVVDIATPIGKGQRGLILAPPRTGTTSLLQSIATSVTTNNPECHVMVVLVDTRPEEVTDFQRAVKGEVVASTFDRPARRPHPGRRARHRAGQAPGRAGPRRGRAARLADAPGPGLQPRRARQRPGAGRRRGRLRGPPDQGVLRCRPQDRGRRLADHPRDRHRRHRVGHRRVLPRGALRHRQPRAACSAPTVPPRASCRPSTWPRRRRVTRRSCSRPPRGRWWGTCASSSPPPTPPQAVTKVFGARSSAR